jgi:hypothetical protein
MKKKLFTMVLVTALIVLVSGATIVHAEENETITNQELFEVGCEIMNIDYVYACENYKYCEDHEIYEMFVTYVAIDRDMGGTIINSFSLDELRAAYMMCDEEQQKDFNSIVVNQDGYYMPKIES